MELIKPILFSNDISNGFKERETSLSISIDKLIVDSSCQHKVLIQWEPPSVLNLLDEIIHKQDMFDLILSWHPKILESCTNARKIMLCDCWINEKTLSLDKKNDISFLTSNKNFTPGHKLRMKIFYFLSNLVEINGFTINKFMSPPRIDDKNIMFNNAKFSIIVENEQIDNWITEKLIDCLVTKTIPIYYGAKNVGDYFNIGGIIQFNNVNALLKIIQNLTPDIYDNKIDIIEENYHKAKSYSNMLKRIDREIDLYLNTEV